MQPSEFWGMDAQEWWWCFDCARNDATTSLTPDELQECYELIQ